MKRLLTSLLLACAAATASLPAAAAPLSLKDAIAKVERETGAKVLSAESKRSGRQTVYRIKVLTREGQVRVIEVPAGT